METVRQMKMGYTHYTRIPTDLQERFSKDIPLVRGRFGITLLYDPKYINKNREILENESLEDEQYVTMVEYLSQFKSKEEREEFEKNGD